MYLWIYVLVQRRAIVILVKLKYPENSTRSNSRDILTHIYEYIIVSTILQTKKTSKLSAYYL